jgi:hypothetical protein
MKCFSIFFKGSDKKSTFQIEKLSFFSESEDFYNGNTERSGNSKAFCFTGRQRRTQKVTEKPFFMVVFEGDTVRTFSRRNFQ